MFDFILWIIIMNKLLVVVGVIVVLGVVWIGGVWYIGKKIEIYFEDMVV